MLSTGISAVIGIQKRYKKVLHNMKFCLSAVRPLPNDAQLAAVTGLLELESSFHLIKNPLLDFWPIASPLTRVLVLVNLVFNK